jgi:hypothetical protein
MKLFSSFVMNHGNREQSAKRLSPTIYAHVISLRLEFEALRIVHQFVASFRYLSLLNIQSAM